MTPALVDTWLGELGLATDERAERDGITSWDLSLDGMRRHDIRVTVILDPSLALLCWVHYAPPIGDSFRVSYRTFLRWNDELPFVKFSIAEDGRPMLTAELAVSTLDRDTLGMALARLVTVCDLLLDESLKWLFPGAKAAPVPKRRSRHEAFLARYSEQLGELVAPAGDTDAADTSE